MDEYLTQLYYNPKRAGSLGGVERLYRDVKKEGKYDISRAQLKKWLMKQDTYTLHRPARRHYKRNRVIVGGIDELWQMDLADMQAHASEETYYVKYTKTGSYKANLHRETNILVYCNIVQPQIVGDKLISLVATVPYQKTSESYDETFYAVENIHYIPVQTKAFQNVKVHLRSSTEEPIPFEHGRATITLHLKLLNYFD